MNALHKKAFASIFFIALFLIAVAVIHLIIKREKNVNSVPPVVTLVDTTLVGTYDCLPYKESAPEENRVCDYGLITTKGDMYILDFNFLPSEKERLHAGDEIQAKGLFTPVEMLSSDHLTKRYTFRGIFSVKESVEVLTKKDTTSNGYISFQKPTDFALAISADQIGVKSYIPPCDSSFDYCLYYIGDEFEKTNFGSAGIRIKKRNDLKESSACMTAPPLGYEVYKPTRTATTSVYSLSVFNVGDAGMGHYANGELYRLAYMGTCHEFETRISATQFANYPEGEISEFKDTELKAKMKSILNGIELKGGEGLVL